MAIKCFKLLDIYFCNLLILLRKNIFMILGVYVLMILTVY